MPEARHTLRFCFPSLPWASCVKHGVWAARTHILSRSESSSKGSKVGSWREVYKAQIHMQYVSRYTVHSMTVHTTFVAWGSRKGGKSFSLFVKLQLFLTLRSHQTPCLSSQALSLSQCSNHFFKKISPCHCNALMFNPGAGNRSVHGITILQQTAR